jgi:DnaK suppressor protein
VVDSTDDAERVLAATQDELEAALAAFEATSVDAGSIGFGKRVGEGTAMAVQRLSNVAAHDGLAAQLAAVRRARAKIADGSYGQCDVCGAAIPPGRLEVLPWATRCLAHADSAP